MKQVVPGAEKVLGSKLTDATMSDVLPAQKMGSFGETMGFGKGAVSGGTKLGRGLSRAYRGVMPATIGVENMLRRAMTDGWATANPQVQAVMRATGGDVNSALRQVAETHPQVINDISKRVDDALGNYRTYNKLERGIKQVIPFYGWDRHIVRSVARLASERPALLDALLQVGQVGQQRQQAGLGPLPSYALGDIRLPGLPGFLGALNGRTPVLSTTSLNPFNTAVDLARIPAGLVSHPGSVSSQELGSGLNPLLEAAIEQVTGRSLLSGASMARGPNALVSELENVPQVKLALAMAGKQPPTKPTSLYQNDVQSLLAAFLGAPVKKVNLQTAHLYAAEEGKPRP